MAKKWIDFTKNPLSASRDLHVSARDVALGAKIDELRKQWELENVLADWPLSGLPYGTTTASDIPYPTNTPQGLVNEVFRGLDKNTVRTKSRAERDFESGVRSVGDSPFAALGASPLRSSRDAALNGLSMLNPAEWIVDGASGLKDALREHEQRGLNPEERGAEAGRNAMVDTATGVAGLAYLPGMAEQLGQLGRGLYGGVKKAYALRTAPELPRLEGPALNESFGPASGYTYDPEKLRRMAGISALGGLAAAGYAPDAEAMPFHSWMKRLGVGNKVEPAELYINPTRSEQLKMLRESKQIFPEAPTVRLLRDLNTKDIYGVEGSSIMHEDMRKHLGLSREETRGAQGMSLPDLDNEIEYLRSMSPAKGFADGGAVTSPLRMLKQWFSAAAPMSVVKNKGGNWFNGSVEGALKGLKSDAPPVEGAVRDPVVSFNNGASERVTWRDPKGQIIEIQEGPVGHWTKRQDPIDSWIDKQLTRYIKNDMATPEDPIRALADRGILHYTPQQVYEASPMEYENERARQAAGFPRSGMGNSDLARNWESHSDYVTQPTAWRDVSLYELEKNPWMEKFLPEKAKSKDTAAFDLYPSVGWNTTEKLGFDHLIDELSNSIDPESGLPQHLQFPADRLNKVSVAQAVERVAQINAWRAAQQAEADAMKANNAATVLHKEYPGDPNGMRWVELKAPKKAATQDELYAALEEEAKQHGLKPGTPEFEDYIDAESEHFAHDWNEDPTVAYSKELQDALTYEGDTMGHCVGGYCGDVLSGDSRIFSLRDAKGQPHVTIEVGKAKDASGMMRKWLNSKDVPEEEQLRMENELNEWYAKTGDNQTTEQLLGYIAERDPEYAAKVAEQLRPRIIQIKGKANRRPNDEYLPFVQDFVKSQPWSDVGDLQNTGLRRTVDVFNSNELKKIQEAGVEVPFHATPEEIKAIGDKVWPGQYGVPPGGKYAQGGSVAKKYIPSVEDLRGIIASIEQRQTA